RHKTHVAQSRCCLLECFPEPRRGCRWEAAGRFRTQRSSGQGLHSARELPAAVRRSSRTLGGTTVVDSESLRCCTPSRPSPPLHCSDDCRCRRGEPCQLPGNGEYVMREPRIVLRGLT